MFMLISNIGHIWILDLVFMNRPTSTLAQAHLLTVVAADSFNVKATQDPTYNH